MAEKQTINYLPQHRNFFGSSEPTRITDVKIGDFITFVYNGEPRWVYVLNPKWEQKLHALDMRHIPRRDLLYVANQIKDSMNPSTIYETFVKKPQVKSRHAYRTYNLSKISNVTRFVYITFLGPGDKDDAHTEMNEIQQEIEGG